jgi:hypothetical protein
MGLGMLTLQANNRSHLKTIFWFKAKAISSFNPQEYYSILSPARLWRHLKREHNTEFGPKDIFEIASNNN